MKTVNFRAFLFPVLSAFFITACGAKNEGTFVGRAEMEIVSYATGKFAQSKVEAENTSFILKPNGAHYLSYLLSFDEKSPLKCELIVTDRNFEDKEVMSIALQSDSGITCEVRDDKGKAKTAKIKNLEGGTSTVKGESGRLNVELMGGENDKEVFRYSFKGKRQ